LFNRLKWFNVFVSIVVIIIAISIPDLVAVLGGILPPWYGTLLPARFPTLA